MVTTNLGLGGIASFVEYTALALAHRGISCLLIVDKEPHDRLDRLANSSVEIRAYNEPQDMGVYQREIQCFKADLIHVNIWERYEPLLYLGRMCDLPLVFHVHFELHAGYRMWADRLLSLKKKAWFLEGLFSLKTALDCVDLYLCCSHSAECNIKYRLWPFSVNTHTIHNAVCCRKPARPDVITGPPKFLQVGHLIPLKNPMLTLRMFERVKKTYSSTTLGFAGEGILRDEMQAYIARRNLQDAVLMGHVRDIDTVYRDHNILVMPSDTEAFPYALLEACAHGLPVIASRVGGIPEIVTHEETGLLFKLRDEDAYIKHCLSLANDPDCRMKLGLNGLEKTRSLFNMEEMITKLIDTYKMTKTSAPNGIIKLT